MTVAPHLSRPQRGAALITALFIVALALILVTALVWDTHLAVRRAGNIKFFNQAYAYALGAEDWAAQILRRDQQASGTPPTDTLAEAWATPIAGLPIEGGQLGGQIEDLQGRFNLNNLVHQTANGIEANKITVEQFRRLRDALGITVPVEAAIVDWLDPDQQTTFPGGAEDGDYLRLTPAYRTGTGMMASVSELRLVAGVTPEIYAALAPYVAALPTIYGPTPINVNTAPLPVLQSLSDKLSDPAILEALITIRQDTPFTDEDAFFNAANIPKEGQDKLPAISVTSEYFRLHAVVSIGNISLNLYSLLQRDPPGNTHAIRRVFSEP